jgi:hypothetical protein
MSELAKKQNLPHLPIVALERMHDGKEMFFVGRLTPVLIVLLERVPGLSSAGREKWQFSLASKREQRGQTQ